MDDIYDACRLVFCDSDTQIQGGRLTRCVMRHRVPLGLDSSNVTSQRSLSLWPNCNRSTTMVWKCSNMQKQSSSLVKLSKVFLLYFRMRLSCLFWPLRATAFTMATSDPDVCHKYPCEPLMCLGTGF